MKKSFIISLILAGIISAQTFNVEKISGKVLALIGTSEKWVEIKAGDKLDGSDLILTDDKSTIQLSKNGSFFMLRNNAALGLNNIKKLSINELILALTMEEVRNVPKNNKSGIKTTAQYGTNENSNNVSVTSTNLGYKKINGAKQLAESGFKESSILVAKETFRKYPETANNPQNRLYFAALLEELNLYDEAFDEYSKINKLNLSNSEKTAVKNKLSILSIKLSKSSTDE